MTAAPNVPTPGPVFYEDVPEPVSLLLLYCRCVDVSAAPARPSFGDGADEPVASETLSGATMLLSPFRLRSVGHGQ